MNHRLLLIDRGPSHVHRWRPVCSCASWHGGNHRSKREAARSYHRHVDHARFSARHLYPRTVTPADRLPEALRVSA